MTDKCCEHQPKLRFKEFKRKWTQKKIRQVLKIGSGKDYKHLEEGQIPVYGSGGYMQNVNDYLYDGKSVCIGRKGTIDKPIYLEGKFWTVDTLFYTHSFNNVLPELTYLIFQKINWKKHNEAGGVPSLSKSTIESIPIVIPEELGEQRKISEFLFAIDKKISLLKEKQKLLEQYKKGVMQKLFKQEIRFKDDDGGEYSDWQEYRLSDVLDLTLNPIKMADESDYELITVRRRNGGVDSRGLYKGKEVLVKSQFALKKNQFVISKRQIVHGACGIVPSILEGAIVSNEYNVFDVVPGFLDVHFFNLFSQTKYMRRAYFINSDGVHIEKLLFKTQSWLKTKVTIPSLSEQKKIVAFVESLDAKIVAIKKQIELTQTFKKGLLQQMFV